MESLTLEQTLEQNQKMIQEWKDECKKDNLSAFYMAVIDVNASVRIFRSEGINCQQLIKQLRYVADSLEKNPF